MSKALKLARFLDVYAMSKADYEAADELRRLSAIEAELRERVKELEASLESCSNFLESSKDRIGYAKGSQIDKAHKRSRALLEKRG